MVQKSNTWFWFENMNEKDILKWSYRHRTGWTNIIHLFRYKDQCQALIYTVLNLWILQNLELLN
jgi:hypothetical protein